MNLCALIVTYNRLAKLEKTIEATLRLPFQYVVVVNNASTDGTASWLDNLTDSRVIIIHSQVNSGGAGGFRYGADYISENLRPDWVMFYDDDAYPGEDFFNIFESIPEHSADVYCSRVIDLGGNTCKMNIPWRKRPESFIDNIKYFLSPQSFTVNDTVNSDAITFSFVGCVINGKVLQNTRSRIDTNLFIYFDDVYYSYYLHNNGYKIEYIPSLLVHHDVNIAKNFDGNEWKVYYLVRNMLLNFHYPKKDRFFTSTGACIRLIKYSLITIVQKNKIKYLSFIFKGIVDGVNNISGKK